jgi:hypothetical protein
MMASEAYLKYAEMDRRLLAMWKAGTGESEEADCLRDEMDGPWWAMTPGERKQMQDDLISKPIDDAMLPPGARGAHGGQGGDVIFIPGKGGPGVNGGEHGKAGSFVFRLADGTDFMTISPDGKVKVRGDEFEGDRRAYDAFLSWLVAAKILAPSGPVNLLAESPAS